MTREDWLLSCVEQLRPDFVRAGFPLPEKIRASCSWPSKSALSAQRRRVGEAWSAECSGDQHFETFISPVLKDSVEVAATMVHELCHCAVGLEDGHRGQFPRCAKALGLEGKMTSTTAGEELQARLKDLIEDVGPYPHARLDKKTGPKKQTTRMLKVTCQECGCVARMTRKWLDEAGTPICGCGGSMEEEVAE
ncbi:MAG: transcription elongation protein SprT [Candidatus Cryosericum sp.]